MINHTRRQTLTTLIAGMLGSSVATKAWSARSVKHPHSFNNNSAYNGVELLGGVSFVVSTLGVNSAVTTITNNSKAAVTVTTLKPGIVEHNNLQYDLNASIGALGITLKPGQRRMVVATPFHPLQEIA